MEIWQILGAGAMALAAAMIGVGCAAGVLQPRLSAAAAVALGILAVSLLTLSGWIAEAAEGVLLAVGLVAASERGKDKTDSKKSQMLKD